MNPTFKCIQISESWDFSFFRDLNIFEFLLFLSFNFFFLIDILRSDVAAMGNPSNLSSQ